MRPPTTRDEGGILVITLDDQATLNDGRTDAYRVALYRLIDSRSQPRVAADLGAVDFLSSSGVAALVGLKKRVDAARGKLVLFRLHPHVRDVLRVTRLDRIFGIADDLDAARSLLDGSPAAS